MPTKTLTTHDLSIGYTAPRKQPVVVAERLNLTLSAGELVCLIGPNGVGKSTLMRTIAGLQPPLHGQIMLGESNLANLSAADRAQQLSMVLTDRVDIGLLSAYGLVALGRHPYTSWSGHLTDKDKAVVYWALEAVDALHLAERHFSELSDGERQKIMIARALAQEPELMLLDEPTAFLDLPRRVEIMSLLRELAHTTNRAILLSTHDMDLALRSADRIWLLAMDGTMHVGSPEDLVLSRAFAEVFHSEGVTFDPQTGSFVVSNPSRGTIALTGSGLALIWTRRALERAGFSVATNGTPPIATIDADDNQWILNQAGKKTTYQSLYDLTQALRSMPSHNQNIETRYKNG